MRTRPAMAVLAVILSMTSLISGQLTAADASATSEGAWVDVEHEQVADRSAWLVDSWGTGTEVWHAGTALVHSWGEVKSRGIVQHCIRDDCTQTFPDLDLPPGSSDRLQGVGGTSASDVWAVGYVLPPVGTARPMIFHWDGSSWTRSKAPKSTSGELTGVSAIAPDDVWAVGTTPDHGPLLLHWNGRRWTKHSSAASSCGWTPAPVSIAAEGRFPLVAGRCQDVGGGPVHLFAIKLDRRDRWVPLHLGDLPTSGVAYVDTTWVGRRAWIVASGGAADIAIQLVGREWHRVAFDVAGAVSGVAGSSRRDVWVVGENPTSPTRLAMHWDGESWAPVETSGIGRFWSVTFLDDGTPYVAGQRGEDSMILRYDRGG